jgi:hypothetical protein
MEQISLRDEFAMAALRNCFEPTEDCIAWMASRAYKIADAMIIAREKNEFKPV